MLTGRLSARPCKALVSLTNRAVVLEAVKNLASMRRLSLEGPRIIAVPVFDVFDTYSCCECYYHILNKEIGIPDRLLG